MSKSMVRTVACFFLLICFSFTMFIPLEKAHALLSPDQIREAMKNYHTDDADKIAIEKLELQKEELDFRKKEAIVKYVFLGIIVLLLFVIAVVFISRKQSSPSQADEIVKQNRDS